MLFKTANQFMKKNELIIEWQNRAYSNLCLCQKGRFSNEIYFEDLCFNAQQSVEKSLKSVLIFHDIEIPKTHNLSVLLNLLIKKSIEIPESIREAAFLNEYAVESRYPGDYYPADNEDYIEACKIANNVFLWAKEITKEIIFL